MRGKASPHTPSPSASLSPEGDSGGAVAPAFGPLPTSSPSRPPPELAAQSSGGGQGRRWPGVSLPLPLHPYPSPGDNLRRRCASHGGGWRPRSGLSMGGSSSPPARSGSGGLGVVLVRFGLVRWVPARFFKGNLGQRHSWHRGGRTPPSPARICLPGQDLLSCLSRGLLSMLFGGTRPAAHPVRGQAEPAPSARICGGGALRPSPTSGAAARRGTLRVWWGWERM